MCSPAMQYQYMQKTGMAMKALQLFGEMQQHGLQPTLVTDSAVISACGNSRRMQKLMMTIALRLL